MSMIKKIRVALFGLPLEERPDVSCGDKKDHYEWVDSRMSCPNCMFKRIAADREKQLMADHTKKNADMEHLADMIADKLITKLKEEKVI